MNFKYDKDYQHFREINKNAAIGLYNAAHLKQKASNSAIKIPPVYVKGNTFYFSEKTDWQVPDFDKEQVERELREEALVPNLFIGFNGDQANTNLNDSIGGAMQATTSPKNESDIITYTIEDSGFPMERLLYYIDGNHELRTEGATSFCVGDFVTSNLGIPHKFAKNVAFVTVVLDNPIKPGSKVTVKIVARHGENTSSNPGAKAEQTLINSMIKNADIVIDGHTHKIFFASSMRKDHSDGRKTPKYKTVYSANFGTRQERSDYADRAGYQPLPKYDGEILRIALVPNKAKTDFTVCVDMINRRDLIDQTIAEKINKLKKFLEYYENRTYQSTDSVTSTYQALAKTIFNRFDLKYQPKPGFDLHKKTGKKVPTRLYFAPLSGFVIGDKRVKNERDIERAVSVLSKLDGACKIVLNGDMVYYKKALTLSNKQNEFFGRKFPEDSFAYLQRLAEKLKPVKDQIIAYNSGVEENKIMKFQSKHLAKMAMNRLQMDESKVYQAYSKAAMEIEQKKIQAECVEKYNKNLLNKEMHRIGADGAIEDSEIEGIFSTLLSYSIKDYEKLPEEKQIEILEHECEKYRHLPNGYFLKKGSPSYDKDDDKQLEYLQNMVALKLRQEDVLLSISKNPEIVNKLFPLSEIDLRVPREDLLQNIFCEMIGIDSSKIIKNTQINSTFHKEVEIKDQNGKLRTVKMEGGYSSSIAKRGAIQGLLTSKDNECPGSHIYFTNTRSGKEYLTKNRALLGDKDEMIDYYYVSAGRFDGSSERVEQDLSSNRIYSFEWSEPIKQEEDIKSRNIFETAHQDVSLLCSSIGYESVLLNKDVFQDVIANVIDQSHDKVFDRTSEKIKEQEKEKSKQVVGHGVSEQFKKLLQKKKTADKPDEVVSETVTEAKEKEEADAENK